MITDTRDIAHLIQSRYTRSAQEENELRRTNEKYREWIADAQRFNELLDMFATTNEQKLLNRIFKYPCV